MAKSISAVKVTDETVDALVTVLDLIRFGGPTTRPLLTQRSRLGRTIVADRVSQLLASGLVVEGPYAASTGGRRARALKFRAEAGNILVVEVGATSLTVGIADLTGRLIASYEEPSDITVGPDAVLGRVEELLDDLLVKRSAQDPPIWGVGLGLAGPVEYATGTPLAQPGRLGWDGYPIRERLAGRYDVPVWVDNDVNLMALGELRLGTAKGERDVLFVKIGTGIGMGLISGGRLHRGANGVAGEAHAAVVDEGTVSCRCGNTGCLETIAAGAALATLATNAAREGRSAFLARRLAQSNSDVLEAADLGAAALYGDMFAVEAFGQTGQHIGALLATLVNFFNPSLVVIGGGVTAVGDLLLASIRQKIYSRSLPLATRDLRIAQSALPGKSGLHGAAFVVIDELFSRQRLPVWISHGSPAHHPEVADVSVGEPEDDALPDVAYA
jgi:glucokinase-like ROK family protein